MQERNLLQRAIIQTYVEGLAKAQGQKGRKALIAKIARTHNLTQYMVEGIIQLAAQAGLKRSEANHRDPGSRCVKTGSKWEPIDHTAALEDLRIRVEGLERKFQYILEGISQVLDDGELMAAHVTNLRRMGKWFGQRNAIDAPTTERKKTLSCP